MSLLIFKVLIVIHPDGSIRAYYVSLASLRTDKFYFVSFIVIFTYPYGLPLCRKFCTVCVFWSHWINLLPM